MGLKWVCKEIPKFVMKTLEFVINFSEFVPKKLVPCNGEMKSICVLCYSKLQENPCKLRKVDYKLGRFHYTFIQTHYILQLHTHENRLYNRPDRELETY